MNDSATGGVGQRGGGRAIHPGSGRRKAAPFPRGRVLKQDEVAAVKALLGERPRERALLIEYLHLIQDKEGCLPEGHLQALAEELKIPMAEVYEVATFYAHFDVVADGEPRPPAVTVRVCDSLSCMLGGADELLATLQAERLPGVRVVRAPCIGSCHTAPAAEVGHHHVDHATAAKVLEIAVRGEVHPHMPAYQGFDAYVKAGGYAVLRSCLSGARKVDDVIAALSDGGLRGLGGAGFPTGRKWSLVRAEKGPRLMAVNGDEGEPGTFKDRIYLESEPHKFLEGMLIAAWAVEAEQVFIYMRDEYPAVLKILEAEIAKLEAAGLAKHTKIHVRRGAGAYICGEESAMIESIEGKRGLPRHRPPYVAQVGVFGRPTLVNNIETLHWVPAILEKGAAWFASQGKNGAKGLRSYSVSGRVKKPGVVLTAAGSTCKDLIDALRRHGRRPSLQGLPAGRRLGRHPAGLHGRHPPRLRPAREARLLRRQPRRGDPVRQGRHEGRGPQPDALLRGRELRPVHALPQRHGEGRQADGGGTMGPRAARRPLPGDGGCLHLRPRPGRAQPRQVRVQVFPGGLAVSGSRHPAGLGSSGAQSPARFHTCVVVLAVSTLRRLRSGRLSDADPGDKPRDDTWRRSMTNLPKGVATVQVDNERVRVIEWRFAPGAETGEHVHGMDYVVVPMANGRLKLVSPQGEESFAELKQGVSYFRKAGVHHNVINANAFEYAFVEIELKD